MGDAGGSGTLDPRECDPSSLAGTPIFCLFSMFHVRMKEDSEVWAQS